MTDKIELFFAAYQATGMTSVYTDIVPKEMMQSEVDASGWYRWKLIPGTLTNDDYKKIQERFGAILPDNFIQWHKRYFFAECDCSIVRLPRSFPTQPLKEVVHHLEYSVEEELISFGLIPFADEGNDSGPLVFDTRNANGTKDFPIRVYDHEYGGDLDGLSEIIFSSFEKMLESLTHFLIETKTKKNFEVIPDFFTIDPDGAGSTGKSYWTSWGEMGRANFEEFGY